MVRIDIPRSYYSKTLPPTSATDAIEAEVEAPSSGARGLVRLKLWPHSAGLTDIHVSVSAPRCTIGAPSASPRPADLTASLPGTRGRCAWRHRSCRRAEPVTYEVPFTTSDPNTLRFEFRLTAAQLDRPVLLQMDMQSKGAEVGGAGGSPAATASGVSLQASSPSGSA